MIPGEGGIRVVSTGIALQAPRGWHFQVKSRSSLAKNGVFAIGGVIDNGYTGEVKVILVNENTPPIAVHAGDKIAQVQLERDYQAELYEVSEFEERDRGANGFGSTDGTSVRH